MWMSWPQACITGTSSPAGLFVRTLSNLESVNLGFNRQNLLLFELNGRQSGHRDGEINDFYNHLTERFAAIPGVADERVARLISIGTPVLER